MFFPQSIGAKWEIWSLARPSTQIVGAQKNGPQIGIVQDSLLGAYLMTMHSTKIPRSLAMNMLALNDEYLKSTTNKFYTGNELLSTIIPEINMSKATNSFDDKLANDKQSPDAIIKVENGIVLQGAIDKKSGLGATSEGSFAHLIWLDFGPDFASRFLSQIQKYTNKFLLSRGFTVGLGDINPTKSLREQMNNTIIEALNKMQDLLKRINKGLLIVPQDTTVEEYLEKKATEYFAPVAGKVGAEALATLNPRTNALKAMITSGSKGATLNAGQMMGCVGHNTVSQARIPLTYGVQRTLPFFYRGDQSPKARGFIEHSFIQGLDPVEFFFHAMSGREGVIDTAIKTGDTGYISRRLIKALEDFSVNYSNKVTNSSGQIIQFMYGDDGIDPVYVERQKFPTLLLSGKELSDKYEVKGKNATTKTKKEFAQIKKDKDFVLSVRHVFQDGDMGQVFLSVNVDRVILNTINGFKGISNGKNKLKYDDVIDKITDLTETLPKLFKNRLNDNANISSNYDSAVHFISIIIRAKLASKEVIENYKFSKEALNNVIEQIKMKFLKSIAQAGEMVGIITAQSIGEPSTQLTLNSFTYETPIIVRNKDKICSSIQLGEFVEMLCKEANNVKYYADKDTTYAPSANYWEIQAPNEDGLVDWYQIEAGTKHPVINEDGSNTMLKVITEYEQEVIGTKAKSFLQLVNGKLVATRGDALKVGDYIPVSTKQIDHTEINELDLINILSPHEYIFGSQAHIAIKLWDEHKWMENNNGKLFKIPFMRSDNFRKKMTTSTMTINDDRVYLITSGKVNLPQKIPLDYNFGYLIGAYCAEGCLTSGGLNIANNDKNYLTPIIEWLKTHNIYSHYTVTNNKIKEGWTSSSLNIFGILLKDVIYKLCGRYSHGKFIKKELIFSNEQFKYGFLNAYFGGDGTIDKKTNCIYATSVSIELLKNVNLMLNTLGIFSTIKLHPKATSNNRGTLPENIHQPWIISIRNLSVIKLANILTEMKIADKVEKCKFLIETTNVFPYMRQMMRLPNLVNGKVKWERRRNAMKDTVFVQIKSIEEVPNTTDYAYDLTVAETRNFIIENGVEVADTFHFSGVGEKSNVTAGVPRLVELINTSKNTKNPYLIIGLKDKYDKQKAEAFKNKIKNTHLREFVNEVEIYYDPDLKNSTVQEDRKMIKDFYKYTVGSSKKIPTDISPWVIRMTLDRTRMVYNQMQMDIIRRRLSNYTDYYVITSDENASKLVLRVHLVGSYANTETIIEQKNKILYDIVIRGIKGIESSRVGLNKQAWRYNEKEEKLERKPEYYIDTDGINLKAILALPEVDQRTTRSVDLWEMYETYGVEAARNTILEEIRTVLRTNGAYVNYHNLSLLVDMMTHNGSLTSISRFGFNKLDKSPISKSSFEMTAEQLKLAALNNDIDDLQNVSAKIMFGQAIKGGTGRCNLVLDESAYGITDEQIDDLFN